MIVCALLNKWQAINYVVDRVSACILENVTHFLYLYFACTFSFSGTISFIRIVSVSFSTLITMGMRKQRTQMAYVFFPVLYLDNLCLKNVTPFFFNARSL